MSSVRLIYVYTLESGYDMGKIKNCFFLLLLALVTLCLGGCSIGGYEIQFQMNRLTDKYVFSINDVKCPVKEARLYLCNYKNLYGISYGVDLWEDSTEDDDLLDYVKDVTLDELSRIYCMDAIAQEQGISLTAEEKSAVSEAAEAYYATLTDAEKSFIGANQSDLETYYTHYALALKLYDAMTEGMDEEISDDEARVIRVYQIYTTDAEKAQTVADKLEAGDDFTTLATRYSETAVTERTVARGEYPQEVEDVAFNLEDGEISGMIETEDSYYFIDCVSKYDEALSDANKEQIRLQREQKELEETYEAFVAEAEIELNKDEWRTVALPEDVSGIVTDSFFETYEALINEIKE